MKEIFSWGLPILHELFLNPQFSNWFEQRKWTAQLGDPCRNIVHKWHYIAAAIFSDRFAKQYCRNIVLSQHSAVTGARVKNSCSMVKTSYDTRKFRQLELLNIYIIIALLNWYQAIIYHSVSKIKFFTHIFCLFKAHFEILGTKVIPTIGHRSDVVSWQSQEVVSRTYSPRWPLLLCWSHIPIE